MSPRLPVDLGDVQKTLLLPVWGRDRYSKLDSEFNDPFASLTLERLDYAFDEIEKEIGEYGTYAWGYRAKRCDEIVRSFLVKEPKGQVINLGAGLDCLMARVDNGACRVLNVDYPDTIRLRDQLFKPLSREKNFAGSILESAWREQVEGDVPSIVVMTGLTMYLKEAEFRSLIGHLKKKLGCFELVFDALSPVAVRLTNRRINASKLPDVQVSFGMKDSSIFRSWFSEVKVIRDDFIFHGLRPSRKTSFSFKAQFLASKVLRFSRLYHMRFS